MIPHILSAGLRGHASSFLPSEAITFTHCLKRSERQVGIHKNIRFQFFKRTEENQLDATECFIAHIICSTCFGHLYAHHQELGTILVLLPHMVCNALVAGGRLLGVEQQAMRPG